MGRAKDLVVKVMPSKIESNFVLKAIKKNKALFRLPSGEVIHQLTLQSSPKQPSSELNGKCLYDVSGGSYSIKKWIEISSADKTKSYQLRYIYFIDKSYQKKINSINNSI